MLTRPATGRAARRRPPLSAATLVLLSGAGALALAPRIVPDPFDLDRARATSRRAVWSLELRDPARAAAVAARILAADQLTAADQRASRWRRDRRRVEDAWNAALETATRSQAAWRAETLEARARYFAAEAPIDGEVERASLAVDALSLGRRSHQLAEAARLALAEARRRAAARDWASANRALERASHDALAASAPADVVLGRYSEPQVLAWWHDLAAEAVEESRRRTVLLVDKEARRLDVLRGGTPRASFPVELGRNGLARKSRAGDRATPEGHYAVTDVKLGARTRYYKALLLDYPSAADVERLEVEKRDGRAPGDARPGDLIEIHGHGGRGRDWTDGCIALSDADMDRLLEWARPGIGVTIVGRQELVQP